MLRRVSVSFVLGSLLVAAACSSDADDGDPSSTSVDGGALDSSHPANPADGNVVTGRDGSTLADAGPGADAGEVADAGEDADAEVFSLPDAGPGDPAGFCQKFHDGSLSSITVCCPDDLDAPLVQFLEQFSALTLPRCGGALQAAMAAGRAVYDPTKEASCLAALQQPAASCPATGFATPRRSADCELVYHGTVAENGGCTADYECLNGLPCQGAVCRKATTVAGGDCAFADDDTEDPWIFGDRTRCIAGETCNGDVCAPLAKTGEDCIADEECVTEDYCSAFSCQPLTPNDINGVCEGDKFCKPDLHCNIPDGEFSGTCVARKSAGTACTDDLINGTECKGYCIGITDAGPGTCHSFCGSN